MTLESEYKKKLNTLSTIDLLFLVILERGIATAGYEEEIREELKNILVSWRGKDTSTKPDCQLNLYIKETNKE